jgi:thymidylate synthase-like protein
MSTRLWVFAAGEGTPFRDMKRSIAKHLLDQPTIHRGKWQTLDVSNSTAHDTYELRNVNLFYAVPSTIEELRDDVKPDLPWADDHFPERVGGEPLNPPPSYLFWPHHGGDSERHLDGGNHQFSHTYPERFWPKYAGDHVGDGETRTWPNRGIRYVYGDLNGVVQQLVTNPRTRQAVLPVWFPEDTGGIDRRVPCSLYYHFMADADNALHVWYSVRACDFVRHFHNDVYFAARLLRWVAQRVLDKGGPCFALGELNMTISSLHAFVGDTDRIET